MGSGYKVGMVQIGENFGGQYYLPYSIGLLQAYAQKHLENIRDFEFLIPFYKRMPVSEILKRFREVKIVFLSTYLWNLQYSLALARQIKMANPGCTTVFGGPQVPVRSGALETMLREYPFIDVACYGEGEVPFIRMLENFPRRSWELVPSIGFIDNGGSFVQTDCSHRISCLDDIPSPYLTGVFDALMNSDPKEQWSVLWETNRGCPFTCAFCAWGSQANNRIYKYGMDRLHDEIDWFSKNRIEFIFCCDANFGIFEKRDLKIVEKVVENKNKYEFPQAFSVQSTKNATGTIFRLQKLLNGAGLQKGVNLALQSLNGQTLGSVKRSNISTANYQELQKLFANEGIPTFSDIILGLPDETYDSFTKGVSSLIEGGQHNRIQFIDLSILENTEMADREYQEKHGLVLQKCRMASHHTSLNIDDSDEIYETEMVVVGTRTMPEYDWVRARVFAWMTSLLHFDKLLQIPFIILNRACSISYRELVEIFLIESDQYPLVSGIMSLFTGKAFAIKSGDSEYIASPEWLNIWWRADEFAFIKLCREASVSDFYDEAERILSCHLAASGLSLPAGLLHEAVDLNARLIIKPFSWDNQTIRLRNNLVEVYKSSLLGINLPLVAGNYQYEIVRDKQYFETWDAWCREVVWYGTKKGAYLYDLIEV